MILLISKHARTRMRERHVSRSLVLKALNNPDRRIANGYELKNIKRFGSKAILVVYTKSEETTFVITVVLTSKLKKYLP